VIPVSTSLADYDYPLPEERIAQTPAEPRDSARLLRLSRRDGTILGHHLFRDLPTLLRPGDLLVLNDTRVVPARLVGRREVTGGKWEGLYLGDAGDLWELLAQTGGRPRLGEFVIIDPPTEGEQLRLQLVEQVGPGRWRVRPDAPGTAREILARVGHVPLPHYIRKGEDRPEDRERYQTVYAHHPGSVAAPTAGLHFTPAVFERLAERKIDRAFVTLHVGLGTFRPITVEDVSQHVLHEEWAEVPTATVEAIERCRAVGGRVVAVGTTTTRTLESAAVDGTLRPWSGPTSLFIRPGFAFHVVDALVTNFHLPRSSLLLLVAAFMGREPMLTAYRTAVEQGYRFFSYGDAMLIE
jgi:S-adenosylmethionine:tRNA ribosyltransferase-isomerase